MSFFSIFSWKSRYCNAHIWSKKSQFCQNNIIWAKKVNRMPFFPTSHAKITALMPIFCQQNANSLKTHFSHVHIFSKNINSLKHTVVSYHFFQSCYEKPLAVVPIVGQKNRQFCQNYTILWAKKVNRMPFSPYFSRKNNFSHAHFS